MKKRVIITESKDEKVLDDAFEEVDRAFGAFREAMKTADKGFRAAHRAFDAAEACLDTSETDDAFKRAPGRFKDKMAGSKIVPLTWRNRFRLIQLAFSRAKSVRI